MERTIGIELRRLSNLTSRYFEQRTNKKQVDAITGTNGWIIGYIARQEEKGNMVCQRDLEARFGVTRSTASKVISLMVQKGLITQAGVPGDKRLKRLVLTDRAREVKKLMDEDHRSFESTLRRGLTGQEIETLFSLLDRLQENLKQMEEEEKAETI